MNDNAKCNLSKVGIPHCPIGAVGSSPMTIEETHKQPEVRIVRRLVYSRIHRTEEVGSNFAPPSPSGWKGGGHGVATEAHPESLAKPEG